MAIEENFLCKQIKALAKAIVNVLFHEDEYHYVLPEDGNYNDYDNLYIRIMDLMNNHEYNQAEDILFDSIDGRNPVFMKMAFSFYEKMALIDEKELKEHNFSVEEVEQGFLDVLRIYNIKVEKEEKSE